MKDRVQVHAYVPTSLKKRLRTTAAARGVSESAIAHSAIATYLDDTDDTPLLLRKLNRIERHLQRIQRHADIQSSAFATFVQMWFAHNPRVAESEMDMASHSALQRFNKYVDHVADTITKGGSFVADLIREDVADQDELAAVAKSAGAGE